MSNTGKPPAAPPAPGLLSMLSGAWLAAAIGVAARLGIADQLEKGPRGVDDLAKAVGASPGPLRRLLRVLAASGVFAEQAPGRSR